ncbi:MAG: response regulator [Crenarchaeota archaeon]|nr:response regulator [Thermoproteota archaeon]
MGKIKEVQYKILLIDDDETIRDTLALLLQTEGYLVDKAANGEEAIKKAKTNFYNLAIVDWRLPDIEGTKLINDLKIIIPEMAKIMLTGFPSMQNAIESVNNRADAFFVKPVDVPTLLEKIQELIRIQEESRLFDEAKMVAFIHSRAKEILQKKNEKMITE